jgi:hypothetical protein
MQALCATAGYGEEAAQEAGRMEEGGAAYVSGGGQMARRHAAKVDGNQREFVEHLRACGLSVSHTHMIGRGFPDILVGGIGRHGLACLPVEIKMPGHENHLTEDEKVWHLDWRGAAMVTSNPNDVLRWFGILVE